MNLNPAMLAVAPAKAPEPPEPAKALRPDEEARLQNEAFDRALKQELDKKAADARSQVVPLPIMPWLPVQPVPVADDQASRIEAAGALDAAGDATRAMFSSLASVQRARASQALQAQSGDALEVAPPLEAPAPVAGPETVHVVVEPGLPPLQPLNQAEEPHEVPLADFPQMLTGQVQRMVKDQQPITQLTFEITPPQIGPVNLQVALENGAVNVQLVALTMQAKQALESQIGQIHTILQSHAFVPGQIKVVTAASGKGGAGGAGGAGQKGDQPGLSFFGGNRKRSGGQDDLTVGRA